MMCTSTLAVSVCRWALLHIDTVRHSGTHISRLGAWLPDQPHAGKLAAVVGLCAFIAGCAISQPRDTTDKLARAHALVHQAEESGASQYAGADLQRARDELQRAEELSQQGEWVKVQRLASEASVDAQLASARTSSGKAQHDLGVLQSSLETLRSEEEHSVTGEQGELPPPDVPEGSNQERRDEK
jgi:Domain of unknown function (DUF4398)